MKRCLKCGTGFAAASVGEIKKCLDLGCNSENLFYGNPIKTSSQLNYTKNNNVKYITFDSKEELIKIKDHFPEAECIMRISTNSEKFGVDSDETKKLLETAQDLKL